MANDQLERGHCLANNNISNRSEITDTKALYYVP